MTYYFKTLSIIWYNNSTNTLNFFFIFCCNNFNTKVQLQIFHQQKMSDKKENDIKPEKNDSVEDTKQNQQKKESDIEQKVEVKEKEQNNFSIEEKEKEMKLMNEDENEEEFEDVEEQYKMVFLVRMDLKMELGKVASQVGHATLMAYKQMESMIDKSQLHDYAFFEWMETGQKKIVLKVANQQDLLTIAHKAKALNINCCQINDAKLTQLEPGSTTVAALGPASEIDLNSLTGHLKLL